MGARFRCHGRCGYLTGFFHDDGVLDYKATILTTVTNTVVGIMESDTAGVFKVTLTGSTEPTVDADPGRYDTETNRVVWRHQG